MTLALQSRWKTCDTRYLVMPTSEHTAAEDADPLHCPAVVVPTCDSPSDEFPPPNAYMHLYHSCNCNTMHYTCKIGRFQANYLPSFSALMLTVERPFCKKPAPTRQLALIFQPATPVGKLRPRENQRLHDGDVCCYLQTSRMTVCCSWGSIPCRKWPTSFTQCF